MNCRRAARRCLAGAARSCAGLSLGALSLVALSLGGLSCGPGADGSRSDGEPADEVAVEAIPVERVDLVEAVSATGLVGFGVPQSLPIEADGLVTATAGVGEIVDIGEEVLRVSDRPVLLAHGAVPLYRELRLVRRGEVDAAGERLGQQRGGDVLQLQQFLIDQGAVGLARDGVFGPATQRAVKEWQRSVGHPATGAVDRSQLVFAAGPIRVASASPVGSPFDEILVTGVDATVALELDARDGAYFSPGTDVMIDGPDLSADGTIASSTEFIGDDGSLRFSIQVRPSADITSAGAVRVTAQRVVVAGAVSVPVRALIALADGRWALDFVDIGRTPVEIGEVVGGMAQLIDVEPGAMVEVPR